MTNTKTFLASNSITGKFFSKGGHFTATIGDATILDAVELAVVRTSYDNVKTEPCRNCDKPGCSRCGTTLESKEDLQTGICASCWTDDDWASDESNCQINLS